MPHDSVPPQPFPWSPQEAPRSAQLRGVHAGVPHTFGWPPPPQVAGPVQVPQLRALPQPSPVCPQLKPRDAQVDGVHDWGGGTSGLMHEERSKMRYSNTFSCGVIGFGLLKHSLGQIIELPVEASMTWKSLNSTRPHWFAGGALTGVLKVYWNGVLLGSP